MRAVSERRTARDRVARVRSDANAIANVLAGSWRSNPPPLLISARELEAALPVIARTNAAALCWWRLRQSALAAAPETEALHDAYRFAALEAELHQTRVASVFRTLRAADIEPVLIKGWSLARLYPQVNVRPYEDLDLIVRPADVERAQAALASNGTSDALVDFEHSEVAGYDIVDWDGLYERSSTVRLETTSESAAWRRRLHGMIDLFASGRIVRAAARLPAAFRVPADETE